MPHLIFKNLIFDPQNISKCNASYFANYAEKYLYSQCSYGSCIHPKNQYAFCGQPCFFRLYHISILVLLLGISDY